MPDCLRAERISDSSIAYLVQRSWKDALRNKWQGAAEIGQEIRRDPDGSILKTGNHILCIDFGTSKSVAAIVDEKNSIQIIRDAEARQFVPSSVRFLENLDYVVGESSWSLKDINSDHIITSVKRALATDKRYNVRGHSLTPEFVASLIIRSIRKDAEAITGRIFSEVIMAAPANFNIAQQNALFQAFSMAGLQIFRMFSEQNAAALNLYSRLSIVERSKDFYVLTVDLGGGTLDVGVAEYSNAEVIESSGPIGENKVGGMDFDAAIVREVRTQIGRLLGRQESSLTNLESATILQEAERTKVALTVSESTMVVVPDIENSDGEMVNVAFEFGRDMFRQATRSLMQRVEECIDSSLTISRRSLSPKDISYVVLAGSGSKIFTVEELVRRKFNGSRIFTEFRDQAVVRGLAAYSLVFTGEAKELLLLDNIAWSLGIKCASVAKRDSFKPALHRETERYAIISGKTDEKSEVFDLVGVGEFVPIRRGLNVKFQDVMGDRIQIEIHTKSAWGTDSYSCGSILVKGRAVRETLNLEFDIDHNGIVVATVEYVTGPNGGEPSCFQINRKFQNPLGYTREGKNRIEEFESETFLQVYSTKSRAEIGRIK